ncbi:hypothetical protein [Pelagicoccus sp. SDUM812005]|uniref:hypothetical protein n=1 Tax=Pelagicoccus sp. SDUM812005 TaxID=3041257 RepID=UPI00280E3282|nr:hypothetical protein [Pelagicoccus sp. SDUM812005]MDQ8181617.1 hypothetical protein [Pelagicoccus sp. SDUM812005]
MPAITHAGITIDFNNQKQRVDMVGADMERSANWLQNASNTADIIQWVFNDAKNVDYLRVVFDKKQELTEGSPNFAFYNTQITSMQQILAAHPWVKFWGTLKTDYDGFGTNNNLPDWIYTGGGYNGGSYDPTQLDTTKYADFIVDYLELMDDNAVTISYFSVGKEWTQVIDAQREKETIDKVTAECAVRGVPVPKFVGPATWGVGGGNNFLNAVSANGWQGRYWGFCTHEYDGASESSWETFVNKAASMGKKSYNEESNLGGGGPTYGVEVDIANPISKFSSRARFYRAGLDGEVVFENWSRGVTKETRSIYFTNNQPGVRMRGYYIWKAFTGNTVWGYYVTTNKSSNLSNLETMTFRKGNSVTTWVMNNSGTTYWNVYFGLSGKTLNASESVQNLYWTNSTAATGTTHTFEEMNATQFKRTIPANSICRFTYTIN